MTHDPSAQRGARFGALPMIALYTLLGLLVGVIGSFTHRSRFAIGDVSLWYGIVVALACALAFALGLRRASRGMGVGIAFASGVTAGILVISAGYSHSVVIVADVVGVVWLLLTPIIVFGAALWPRIPARPRGRDDAEARPGPTAGASALGTAQSSLPPAVPDARLRWEAPQPEPQRDQEPDR